MKQPHVLEVFTALEAELRRLKRRPKRGKPATADAIAKLEAAWAAELPPSYRALLEMTDGFSDRARDPTVIGLLPIAQLLPGPRSAARRRNGSKRIRTARRPGEAT